MQSLIDLQLRQYQFHSDEVERLEKTIHELSLESGLSDGIAKMETIPGLGFLTCVTVASELGSSQRFKNAREAAASCGLTPRLHGSAGRIRAGRITKHGPYQESSWWYGGHGGFMS